MGRDSRHKGIVREDAWSRNGVIKVEIQICLSGHARDDDFQLVYASLARCTTVNQSPDTSRSAAAGARSPTTDPDTLILSLVRTSFHVDQYRVYPCYILLYYICTNRYKCLKCHKVNGVSVESDMAYATVGVRYLDLTALCMFQV